jgi:hypothetical protein
VLLVNVGIQLLGDLRFLRKEIRKNRGRGRRRRKRVSIDYFPKKKKTHLLFKEL